MDNKLILLSMHELKCSTRLMDYARSSAGKIERTPSPPPLTKRFGYGPDHKRPNRTICLLQLKILYSIYSECIGYVIKTIKLLKMHFNIKYLVWFLAALIGGSFCGMPIPLFKNDTAIRQETKTAPNILYLSAFSAVSLFL